MADEAHAPNKGGRPPKYPGEGKRPTVTFRCRGALRAKIVASAESADRSLSEEIERILENHFQAADLRTLIREELEADRKRQSINPSTLIAMGRKDLARGPHSYAINEGEGAGALFGPKDIFASGALKYTDQSKPD